MAESLQILILEDNPTDAELTQFELEEGGFIITATVVATEKDYVRELQASCFDLILSDYDLPQYNGALALREASERCPDTPFILVTGAVSEDRAIEILTQGAKDYVLKNRLQQRLVPAVRRALAESEELRARKKAEEELREAHKNLESQVGERTAELQKELEHRRQIEATLLKYNERLEILSYTAGRLLASDKPQQIVEELCSRVMKFLDCHAFFNFLADESAGRLHLNAFAGIPREAAREIEWLEYGVAVCGCAAQDGCRIVAEDIPTTPDVRTELVKSFGIKAYACHPLMEQNHVIGTLSFGTRTRTTFTEDDLAMMKAVTDQVAMAMSRVRMEDALRESEFRERSRSGEMQAVMDVAPVAVWIAHDSQCLRITGNRYADEIMRVSHESNVSVSARPGDAAVTYKVLRNGLEMKPEELPAQMAAATGKPVEAEMLDLVFADGRVVRLIEGAMPLFDAEGNVRGSVAAGADVTRLRKVEEELRQTTERFEMAQRAAQVGTWDWNVLTGEVRWSSQMFELLGIDPMKTTASFEAWKSIIYSEDVETASLRIDQALKQHSILNSDYRVAMPDGQIRWINAVGEGQYDGRNRPIRMMGICMDITDRKQIEEAILLAKGEWERTFDTVPDLIAILDNQHRIVRVNKSMANRLGVSPQDCIGLYCHETVHGMGDPPSFCPHRLTCGDGLQHVAEVHEPQLGGDFLVSTSPLRDLAGRLVGSVHVARDITVRKRAEDLLAKQTGQLQERTAQLEAANLELESFSYSVSHDLRAPLRAIDGISRIIMRNQEGKLDENTRRQFNMIRDNVRMMGVLIDNLLSFSRVQKATINISVIDMDKLARDVWNEIQASNKERDLEFRMTTVLPALGDQTLIRQVLINLMDNAVKFTKNRKPGIIEMSSYKESDKMIYCLKDNGAGFDMEYSNKLFGVFQRLHSAEEYEGTGVGLAIVQRIINRHGGRVWGEGKENSGAAFYFALPLK